MKKILLTVVLGVAVGAMAQTSAPPAQGQSAAPPAQGQAAAPAPAQSAAPVIKDPAEYNAYVAAVQSQDPAAKISGLEAFITQYPNSVMKNQALELLMGAYQQSNNAKKTMETATKLVTADTCNVRALALLSYFDRMMAQGGDPNAKQLLIDGKKYGQQGLDCMPKFTKPEGTSDADFQKTKDQMNAIFHAAIGMACLQDKDNACAAQNLRTTVDANPTDFSVVYPLALAYLGQTPPDYQNGIWFAARAAAVAPAANQAAIEKYARSQYVKFHAGDDGWTGGTGCGEGEWSAGTHSASAHSGGAGAQDGARHTSGQDGFCDLGVRPIQWCAGGPGHSLECDQGQGRADEWHGHQHDSDRVHDRGQFG